MVTYRGGQVWISRKEVIYADHKSSKRALSPPGRKCGFWKVKALRRVAGACVKSNCDGAPIPDRMANFCVLIGWLDGHCGSAAISSLTSWTAFPPPGDVPVLHMRADGLLRFVGWDNMTIGKRNINAKKCEFPRREESIFGIGKD